jgi:CheY-like chemotaxis protein
VGQARVLCVDDEPLIRTMLADSVAELGLTALTAKDGEEAVALLDDELVDLVITDIRMGAISGWEVAEHARALDPAMPIIYVSGFPSKGKSLPGAIYIAKPFRPHEIETAIRRCLGALENA